MRDDLTLLLTPLALVSLFYIANLFGLMNSPLLMQEHELIMAERDVGNVSLIMECSVLKQQNPQLQARLNQTSNELFTCDRDRDNVWFNLNFAMVVASLFGGGLAGYYIRARMDFEAKQKEFEARQKRVKK